MQTLALCLAHIKHCMIAIINNALLLLHRLKIQSQAVA